MLDDLYAGPSLPRSLFFADDIALCPTSAHQGQQMVNLCADWLNDHGMALSHSKCASSFAEDILLGGVPFRQVPPVDGYPYLGVPFVPGKGFLFAKAVDAGVAAASSALTSLMSAGARWGPRTRVSLYRAFIRSRWEYALPLLAASLPIPTPLDVVANRFVEVENRALNWCSAPVPAGRIRMSRFLLGIPPPDLRVRHLLICWTFEGNALSNSHPIRCLPHWEDAVYHNGPRPPIWSNHGADPRVRAFFHDCPDPLSAISPSPNDRGPPLFGPDFSVAARSPILPKLALPWRIGTFGHFRRCPLCLRPFSPKHIASCNLLASFDAPALQAWEHTRHFPPGNVPLPERYSLIDDLLNRREGRLALHALQALDTILLPP